MMVNNKCDSHLNRRVDAHRSDAGEKLAYKIDEASAATGIGRTSLYEAIKAGHLKSIMACGRRLILRQDLERFLASCRDVG